MQIRITHIMGKTVLRRIVCHNVDVFTEIPLIKNKKCVLDRNYVSYNGKIRIYTLERLHQRNQISFN